MPKRTPEHNAKIGEALRARGVGQSPTKHCPRCQQELPRSAFRVRPNGFTDSYCLPCHREYAAARQRKWRAAHPENREHQHRINRKATLKRYHGVTPDDYEALFTQQNGRCAICGRGPGSRRYLNIDHYHETPDPCHQRPDLIRGLLCDGCNRALGLFGDDADRLRAAADYIDRTDRLRIVNSP